MTKNLQKGMFYREWPTGAAGMFEGFHGGIAVLQTGADGPFIWVRPDKLILMTRAQVRDYGWERG
jgi:hypothetical protein